MTTALNPADFALPIRCRACRLPQGSLEVLPLLATFIQALCEVEGLVRLMATPDGFGGPVNLGNPAEFTVAELAELVLEITCSRSRIVRHPLPRDDPKQRRTDIGVAQEPRAGDPALICDRASSVRWPISIGF